MYRKTIKMNYATPANQTKTQQSTRAGFGKMKEKNG